MSKRPVVFACFTTPPAVLCVWYMLSFLPHLGELKALAAQGNQAIKNVRTMLYSMAVIGETEAVIRSHSIRQAYSFLTANKRPGSMLSWHMNNALWLGASKLHFTDEEMFGIWVECSIHGCGHGLEEAAHKQFGKTLNDLSLREMADLVAAVRSPTRYAPGTWLGQHRADKILGQIPGFLPAVAPPFTKFNCYADAMGSCGESGP